MTIKLPDQLERDIRTEVLNGHFASLDDAIAEAVRLLLLHGKQERTEAEIADTSSSTLSDGESADLEAQRRLFAAGLLSEIKPPIRDLTPYQDRKAVPIDGEPLSETFIRDRR